MDWKNVETMRANGIQWMQNNHVKAFYSVVRHKNFSDGARVGLELSGLGKLRPNMVLLGYKDDWRSCPKEAKEFYQVLTSGFDVRLSVGVLRISGGLDLSALGEAPVFTVEPIKARPEIMLSVDSGLDDMKDLPPPPPYDHDYPSQLSYRLQQEMENQGKKKSRFSKAPKKEKTRPVLVNSQGNEIADAEIIRKMTAFRNEEPLEGFIDVYWLYDDGGLTLLLPYILMTRKKYEKCQMRVFVLGDRDDDLDVETKNMAVLLAKFRISFHDVVLLSDVTKYPGKKIR